MIHLGLSSDLVLSSMLAVTHKRAHARTHTHKHIHTHNMSTYACVCMHVGIDLSVSLACYLCRYDAHTQMHTSISHVLAGEESERVDGAGYRREYRTRMARARGFTKIRYKN